MGFWGIIRAGWRGAFSATAANWRLFGVLLLLNAALAALANLADPSNFTQKNFGFDGHVQMVSSMSPLHLAIHTAALSVFSSILAAPAMVAVHRHVLLHEDHKIGKNIKRLAVFAALFLGIKFVLIGLPGILRSISHWFGFEAFISLWLLGRLALTYPAAALDQANPLGLSWQRTRGHWWFVAGVMVLGLAPAVLIVAPFTIMAINSTPATVGRAYAYLAAAGVVSGQAYTILGAALASELFRKFGGVPAQG